LINLFLLLLQTAHPAHTTTSPPGHQETQGHKLSSAAACLHGTTPSLSFLRRRLPPRPAVPAQSDVTGRLALQSSAAACRHGTAHTLRCTVCKQQRVRIT